MRNFKNLRNKNVYFTAIKIRDSTDKMFAIMKESFGENFLSTEKKLPTDFFKVMLKTMSESIQSSQLKIASDMEHMVRSSRVLPSKTESICEIAGNASAKIFDVQYETPQFPKLPKKISKEYWENFQDRFEWSIRGETQI